MGIRRLVGAGMVCVCNMVGGGNYDDVHAVDDAENDDGVCC